MLLGDFVVLFVLGLLILAWGYAKMYIKRVENITHDTLRDICERGNDKALVILYSNIYRAPLSNHIHGARHSLLLIVDALTECVYAGNSDVKCYKLDCTTSPIINIGCTQDITLPALLKCENKNMKVKTLQGIQEKRLLVQQVRQFIHEP